MINVSTLPSPGQALPPREERLRGVVQQLEGVFVEQLFKAMRETVPTDGLTSGGAGEAMFTSLLDQHLAEAAPARWSHGLADALLRQLQRSEAPAPAVGPGVPDPVSLRSA